MSAKCANASKITMLRGSVVQLRRKCGKASCHCADGSRHETWVLSYSEAGRTRLLPIPPHLLTSVRRAAEKYRSACLALRKEAHGQLKALRTHLAQTRREAL
jgi:hypothetical protein